MRSHISAGSTSRRVRVFSLAYFMQDRMELGIALVLDQEAHDRIFIGVRVLLAEAIHPARPLLIRRVPAERGAVRQVQQHIGGAVDQSRGILGALKIARHPVKVFSEHGLASTDISSTIQVSLLPPPCDEFTTSEPLPQRDPRQSAGGHIELVRLQHEGAQVQVARRQFVHRPGSGRSRCRAWAAPCNCADWRGSVRRTLRVPAASRAARSACRSRPTHWPA